VVCTVSTSGVGGVRSARFHQRGLTRASRRRGGTAILQVGGDAPVDGVGRREFLEHRGVEGRGGGGLEAKKSDEIVVGGRSSLKRGTRRRRRLTGRGTSGVRT
jgi:hypothetical protein